MEGFDIWKEVTTRLGKVIVFTELKKFMLEFIDTKPYGETDEDYLITCPKCKEEKEIENPNRNYTKTKLSVYKSGKTGHCFRCGTVYIDLNEDLDLHLNTHFTIKGRNTELLKLDEDLLSVYHDANTVMSDEVRDKLVGKRSPYILKLAQALHYKYDNDSVYIPFFYNGEVIYYTINYLNENSRLKYFLPPIASKPIYIARPPVEGKVVLSEGVHDAGACVVMYADRGSIACLGSTITQYQVEMMKSLGIDDVVVFMDETKLSYKINKLLINYGLNAKSIEIVHSDGEDPDEYLKRFSQ